MWPNIYSIFYFIFSFIFTLLLFIHSSFSQKCIYDDYGPDIVQQSACTLKPYYSNGDLPFCPGSHTNSDKKEVFLIDQSCRLLPKHHYYRKRFLIIDNKNILFDCNNSTLHGLSKGQIPVPIGDHYKKGLQPSHSAFRVQSSIFNRNQDIENRPVENITIKNCNIVDYQRGIIVGMKSKKLLSETKRLRKALKRNERNNIYNIMRMLVLSTPYNVQILNTNFIGIHLSSIHVGKYVSYLTISGGIISESGSVGIYLESGSGRCCIEKMTFSTNGYYKYLSSSKLKTKKKPHSLWTKILRKHQQNRREGIAIDASAFNIVRDNHFENNAAGGIFLYKNCWEGHSNLFQPPRLQHSRCNVLKNNTFLNEKIGIWIASRQSRNLSSWDCGDPLLYSESKITKNKKNVTKKYYMDYAEDNSIISNNFIRNGKAVVIEDDGTIVKNNTFCETKQSDVTVFSPILNLLSKRAISFAKNGAMPFSINNTVITNNKFSGIHKQQDWPLDTKVEENGTTNFTECIMLQNEPERIFDKLIFKGIRLFTKWVIVPLMEE